MGEQGSTPQQTQLSNAPKVVKFEQLAERVNSIFDDITRRAYEIFESNGRQFGHDMEDWFRAESELLHPVHVDIVETDQALEVKAEVPGFAETELQVSVEPKQLTITGKRETTKQEKRGKTIYSERCASDLLRVVPLPVEVDAAKASATLKNGVLGVMVPKAAKALAVRVQAKSA
jgi:HSP20 family protein